MYGENLPPALLSDIGVVHANSQILSKLVDDVLDMSQVEAGRMALSKEWVALPELIDAAVLAAHPLFQSRGFYLETAVAEDLPPVYCDSTRIREVVLNLLSNAGRYTEAGGVRIEARRNGADVVVSVTDTGPGIAPVDQERLFEPFQQLDNSPRRRHGGSGLGLSISKRFVEMHDGKMWLESQVGAGTTFFFSLPIATPAPTGTDGGGDWRRWFNPYESTEYRVRTRRSKAPGVRVLPRFVLLDPGKTLHRLFGRYVQGVETAPVSTVEEAVDELSVSPAQALVVNAAECEEAGTRHEMLDHLPFDTPTITCWVPGENEAARQLGVVHYLLKPVSRQSLLSALDGLEDEVKTVLLVDDRPEALRLFARMLASSERTYRVLRARSGQRALALLRQERPDVMLLDLVMPGMTGFQVLHEKSRDPEIRGIPTIIISASDPSGIPIVSDELTVRREGGLSARDLLSCIQAVSAILVPPALPAGPEPPETPGE